MFEPWWPYTVKLYNMVDIIVTVNYAVYNDKSQLYLFILLWYKIEASSFIHGTTIIMHHIYAILVDTSI